MADLPAPARRRLADAVPEDGFGDVFLVVDGWATLRSEFEDLEPVLADIATRGLSYGVHLVATADPVARTSGPAISDLFGSGWSCASATRPTRWSTGEAAANVPGAVPGRGITADGLHLLAALPQVAGTGPADLVKAIAAAWAGPPAPPVRMLPRRGCRTADAGRREPREPARDAAGLPLGIAEADLRPVPLDFAGEPHLLRLRRRRVRQVARFLRASPSRSPRRFTPEQARIVLVDYRRSLLGAITSRAPDRVRHGRRAHAAR